MTKAQQLIFSHRAIQQYIQGRQKDVLPHLMAPPTFLFLWLLLGLLLAAIILLVPQFSSLW